ncbi:glycerol-3-phosphate cytidylyltransferase [Alloalcanivorax sp. C16-2]|uniref:glycerol-3-phosphate cytidylyltransferase n=1 Tax=Alloalcanivorax TaxID=3020832 RepID=UPI0019333120|nr:glycerol-3-phosphate cytidylyltransferase [Alloalcanivorax marinus]MBL7251078.1 glycerol-3-phosphate cytidylyltransferase [Alloalcanivorax marinus]
MTTILTYGTFDLFHFGHVRLFARLAGKGDRLIVGVSTDAFNARKGKAAFFSYQQRVEMVRACRYVDQVIPERHWDQKADDILKYGVDIFAMGDDWRGHFDHLGVHCRVLYLPRTETVSTTSIKSSLAGALPVEHG